MSSFIYPVAVGIVVFAGGLAVCFLYDRWNRTFGGMYDDGSAVIADQGDDWAPFFRWLRKPEVEPKSTTVWIVPKRPAPIEIVIDETRPAWYSAVGVETATRGDK